MSVADRLKEANAILELLGLPRAQINDRSAYTLLALLDLGPDQPWGQASAPLRGITPIMTFAKNKYAKEYAPNTRETFRRQTMHQFVEAGIALQNPDNPKRAVNSPAFVYQIEPNTLQLLRQYGSTDWDKALALFLSTLKTLRVRYASEREMERIPLLIAEGRTITLTPGGQNILVEQIINEFAPRFTPGATSIYVGDTGDKYAHFDKERLSALGVEMDSHGKMPDVIIHDTARDWLVLIEAVTSHGPINPKRKTELTELFCRSRAGLVFVTTFLTRKAFHEYMGDIAWETEVWIAEAPTHMVHFNGERFLGPYKLSLH
ncbi:MAG: BsuBI/PstI family type II restriction endonuclease [Fimbriimonas sp.]|nr:BsuBI/PstI family type II restriction endonuclease [Fimbriimonas sp.]